MPDELAKATRRRAKLPEWQTYFSGAGIDIGAGNDGLGKYAHHFPNITSVREWDMPDGDAQYMASIADETFDFVHSSHCLEHMEHAGVAFAHWWRILKRGGYLIVVVPDWELYEHCQWPSRFNSDHKQRFIEGRFDLDVINPRYLAIAMEAEMLIMHTLTHTMPHEPPYDKATDYTTYPACEPVIELVLRKP